MRSESEPDRSLGMECDRNNEEQPQQQQHQTPADASSEQAPLCSVGIIADIQYAPIPDGCSYSGTPRYYRHALEATQRAFERFAGGTNHNNSTDNGGGEPVDLVINLGDIVDGKCQEIRANGGAFVPPNNDDDNNNDDSSSYRKLVRAHTTGLGDSHPGMLALLEVLYAMRAICDGDDEQHRKVKLLHIYGNHCLYNLKRSELANVLGIPMTVEPQQEDTTADVDATATATATATIAHHEAAASAVTMIGDDSVHDEDDLVGYYSHVHHIPHQHYEHKHKQNTENTETSIGSIKFIVVDTYDIALMQRSPTVSQKRARAVEILRRENPRNTHNNNPNSPEGLDGIQKRFVAFGGGVGATQLQWLRDELEATRQWNSHSNGRQIAIVLSHQPLHPGSCNPVCLAWNYFEVLEVLRSYSDVVVASLAGHAHKGGYAVDAVSGIHFRVVEAVLESKPPIDTFGILNVYHDRLELVGYGDCESAVYELWNNQTIRTNKNHGQELSNGRGGVLEHNHETTTTTATAITG